MGKQIISAIKFVRHMVWILTLSVFFLLMFSVCVEEQELEGSISQGEEAWILMTVKLPQTSLPSTSRAVQTDAESFIANLRVLVFESGDNGYVFSYQAAGSEMDAVEGRQRFRALLRSMDTSIKCMVVANAEQAFASYTPTAGDPESDVRTGLEMSFAASGLSYELPMYGEVTMPEGLVAGNNSITVSMLRAVARVDVVKNLLPESDDFTLTGVYVCRAYDRLRPVPDPLADTESPKVDAPSIPVGASMLSDPVSKTVAEGADSIMQIYVPESAAAATNNDRLRGTTVVIVGGRWGGGDNRITYYRADIDPDGTGISFGQLLRNHRYIFNIRRVMEAGWDTVEEAANNFSSSIDIDVEAWEEFSADMYFGENRFALSARDVSLRYVINRTKRIDVESTLPYTVQWLRADGQPLNEGISQVGATTTNDDFDVSIVKDDGDAETVTHLLFRTCHDNYDGSVIERVLRVTAYKWTADITVRQDNSAVYSNRYINILSGKHNSGYPAGYLGTTTTLPTHNEGSYVYGGLEMRMILDKQFAPTGVVKIGGFGFEEVTDASSYLSTTAASNLVTMERLFGAQDIIYLSYQVNISNDVANRILSWLSASPHRVLIVGTDSSDSNANLLSKLTDDGTWAFNHTSGSFIRAETSSGSDDFFYGAFGYVTNGSTFNRRDTYSGYTANSAAWITPLILDSSGGVVFCVNKERRIIYHGDANFFMTSQLSNANGDVTSNLDRLMGNVWAWAVEQVIYGDD